MSKHSTLDTDLNTAIISKFRDRASSLEAAGGNSDKEGDSL